MNNKIGSLMLGVMVCVCSANALADKSKGGKPANAMPGSCKDILNAINVNNELGGTFSSVYDALKAGADEAIVELKGAGVGLGNDMWATINDRDGAVCAVAFTGENRGDQWPGSRIISAEKAYTANAYSLPGFAVSTANLYAANMDGGGFMGLQFSNLMNPAVAYGNPSASGKGNLAHKYGTKNDPLVGRILGGHIIFGGGSALYSDSAILGGVGVSGDTACYDHAFGWMLRDKLGLDRVPSGVAAGTDNLLYDEDADGLDGFEHVDCGFNENDFVKNLPANYPIGLNP